MCVHMCVCVSTTTDSESLNLENAAEVWQKCFLQTWWKIKLQEVIVEKKKESDGKSGLLFWVWGGSSWATYSRQETAKEMPPLLCLRQRVYASVL